MTEQRAIRVLLVDSSPAQGSVLAACLESAGMTVRMALDGPEALDLLPDVCPDVLLTELILPFFSGLELLRRCLARQPGLKAMVVTSVSADWAMAASFAAGAQFLLLKPVDRDELIRLTRELAGGLARQLEELLLAHGAPGRLLGLGQGTRCAALLAQKKCSLLKEAYIEVAARERTTPICVSKNVERFIREFWAVGDPSFLGLAAERPPGNKDFLAALARAATFPL